MARPRFPRLKDGQQLEPQHLNMIYAELERWNKIIGAGGIVVTNGVAGPVVSGGGSVTVVAGVDLTFARLPAGGIAAGATGMVTFYTAYNTLGSDTATVRNQWNTAAPSLKKCVVARMAGVDELAIISWDCS
jgi:hypothetical protein